MKKNYLTTILYHAQGFIDVNRFHSITGLILLAILISNPILAQQRVVKGTLTADDGLPVPGVNIVEKGTQNGTITDLDGNYSIIVPLGSVLVFTFIGYEKTEMIVTENNSHAYDSSMPKKQKKKTITKPRDSLISESTTKQKVNNTEKNSPAANEDSTQNKQTKTQTYHHTIPGDGTKTLSPYFFVQSDNPDVDQMPLKSTSAEVSISGVIADVTVKQVYINTSKNTLEAIYIFPGSTKAAVYGMSMTVGDRHIVAKIKEKQQARTEYRQAKEAGKTATLLEQKRPNIFQMNVANILPDDTITVELHYTEMIEPVEGVYEFIYPTVVGPRYSEIQDTKENRDENWVSNPYLKENENPTYLFDLKATVNTGIPLQKITCNTHDIHIKYHSKSCGTITLNESEKFGGNRDFVLQYRLRNNEVQSGVLLYEHKDENFFLVMAEPPKVAAPKHIPPREYVFIIDVSGSMSGFPLNTAKDLIKKMLQKLRKTDRFNIMFFAGGSNMLAKNSIQANKSNVKKAFEMINQQSGGGGTQIYQALQKALQFKDAENYSRTFVVITDGYVAIEKELFRLIRDNLNNANLFAFGIGNSVNRHLIEGMAYAGMGEPFVSMSKSENEKVTKRFIKTIENPVLTNIRLQAESIEIYDVEPSSIPDVLSERPLIIYGKYKNNTNGKLTISGLSGKTQYTQSYTLTDSLAKNNEALRYLWARNRLKYLSDYGQKFEYDQTEDELQQAITNLGLKYNLLTKYTSFIAVDNKIRNKTGASKTVKQPLPLPKGVSNYALASKPAQTMIQPRSGKQKRSKQMNFFRGKKSTPVPTGSIINSTSNPSITLSPQKSELQEVVVVGYGTYKHSDLISSISSVTSSSLNETTKIQGIESLLQGKVSGVNVSQNSGEPDNSYTIRIRGANSVTGDNYPLFVIDGIPFSNNALGMGGSSNDNANRCFNLNPNDIKSVSIIKDASGTALYGSRAANGVIIINTNSKKSTSSKISFKSLVTIDKVNKLPDLQKSYAQGKPINGKLQWQGADKHEIFSWGPKIDELEYDTNNNLVPKGEGTGIPAKSFNNYDFFKTAVSYQNYLNIRNNSSYNRWNLSLARTHKNSVIPKSEYVSNYLNLSTSTKISQELRINSRIFYTNSTTTKFTNKNNYSALMFGVMTTSPTFDNSNSMPAKEAVRKEASYLLADNTQRSYNGGLHDNPYWIVNQNGYKSKLNNVIAALDASRRIFGFLDLETGINLDGYIDSRTFGYDKHSAASPQGRFTTRNDSYYALNSFISLKNEKQISRIRCKTSVKYNHFTLQHSIKRTDYDTLMVQGDFSRDNAKYENTKEYDFNRYRHSLHANLQLNGWQTLYLKYAPVIEWSSTLPENKNRFTSHNTGIVCVLSQLKPLQRIYHLNNAKIRANWTNTYKEAPLFINPEYYNSMTYDLEDALYFYEKHEIKRTENLKPENINALNIGLATHFVRNKYIFEINWYNKKITNQVVPSILNNSEVELTNIGTINSKGWDIDVIAHFDLPYLLWKPGIVFSKNETIVNNLNDKKEYIPLAGFRSIASCAIAGEPLGVLYGTRYKRNDEGKQIVDKDGFYMVDEVMGVIGDPNPDWTMGISNNLSWKNFNLKLLFDIRKGGDVWNGTANTLHYFGVSQLTADQREITNHVFDGVTIEGKNNTTAVDFANPNQSVYENRWVRYGIGGVAEDAIEDGSWFRVRNIEFSYIMPEHIVPARIRNIELAVFAHNLLLFTKYSGVDPEINLTGDSTGRGLDYFNTPNTKSFGFSIQIRL